MLIRPCDRVQHEVNEHYHAQKMNWFGFKAINYDSSWVVCLWVATENVLVFHNARPCLAFNFRSLFLACHLLNTPYYLTFMYFKFSFEKSERIHEEWNGIRFLFTSLALVVFDVSNFSLFSTQNQIKYIYICSHIKSTKSFDRMY